MRDFDAIIFDLDGTLVDSLPGIEYSVQAAIAETCPGVGYGELRRHIGPPIAEVLRRATGLEDDAVINALVAAFRRSYDTEGWLRTVAFPGVKEVLSAFAARDARLFVLTNKPAPAAERILVHLGLRRFFEHVAAPALHVAPRPKAEVAAELREFARLVPDRTLLVGDSHDDALAAERCGFAFAAAEFGYGAVASRPDSRADFILECFSDLFRPVQLQPL